MLCFRQAFSYSSLPPKFRGDTLQYLPGRASDHADWLCESGKNFLPPTKKATMAGRPLNSPDITPLFLLFIPVGIPPDVRVENFLAAAAGRTGAKGVINIIP